jgi:apolipoprotein N-acyltransferase
MEATGDPPPDQRSKAARIGIDFAALIIVGLVLVCANGAHIIPPAAWIGPALLICFLRARPKWLGLLAAYPMLAIVWIVQWGEVFRLSGPPFYIGALIFSAMGMLPYAADRLIAPRLAGITATLVFPTAFVATEILITKGLPFGLWGSLAYSQAFVPPVANIAALLGFWGISFLLAWTAAIANHVWENRRGLRASAPALAAWAAVAILLLGYGLQRQLSSAPARPPLDVAIVLPPVEDNANYDAALAPRIIDHLFRRSEAEAGAGARLVTWAEDSFFLAAADEPALLARATDFARHSGAWLHMSYGLRTQPGTLRYENRSVLIAPSGARAWTYRKSYPVPGYEERHMLPGDGRVVHAVTPLGRLAGAICFDADHQQIMRQVGADLLVLPSDDWPAVVDLHAAMVTLRAIEYGVPILRPTINGRSLLLDGRGRVIAALPVGPGQSVAARLESAAEPTPYRTIGDAFAWTCLALLGLLVLLAFGPRRRLAEPPTA